MCDGVSLTLLESPFLLASAGDLTRLKAAAHLSLRDTDREGCTLLHHASKNGHLPVMQYLIDSGINVDAVDRNGNTALHQAVASGQVQAMDLLLTCSDGSAVNQDGDPPLHVAVKTGNKELLGAFLAHHEANLFPGSGNQTVLHMLAEDDLIESAQIIFNSKPFEEMVRKMSNSGDLTFLRQTNKDGLTVLCVAACNNSYQILELLLTTCKSLGLSAEHVCFNLDDSGSVITAMLAAVDSGSGEVVKVLLHHGASPLAVKDKEPPPLHLACIQGRQDVVKSMVEHSGGKILNHKDDSGRTALHCAVLAHGVKILSYILSIRSMNIDIADTLGRTPLHTAVLAKSLSCIKQLIDTKANLFLKDNQCRNIMHFAVMNYQEDVLQYLLLLPEVSGLMLEADRTGDTAFHLAIKCGNIAVRILEQSMVEDVVDTNGNHYIHLASASGDNTLLRKVLEVSSYRKPLNEANKLGETPLHLAAKGGHEECIELLLDRGAFPRLFCTGRTALFDACANGHVACAKILLNRFPFQKNWVDHRGNTALHFAAQSYSPAMVQFLLDSHFKISLNKDSQSFLELAVETGCVDSVRAALKHSKWEECLDCHSPKRPHVMLQFIHRMPRAAKLVLDRSFECAAVEKSHPKYCEKFTFKYLHLQSSERDTLRATKDMIEVGDLTLINHPVVNMYIKQKWNKYGFWVYTFVFVLRLILAILKSVFTVLVFNPDRQSTSVGDNLTNVSETNTSIDITTTGVGPAAQFIRTAALVINLALSVHLLLVIMSVGFYVFNLVTNAALWIFAFTVISNFVFLLTPNPLLISPAAALACFFSWLMVFIALGFYDIFGIYVRMFLRVTRTVLVVLTVSLVLILAFSFAFYILIDTLPGFSKLRYSMVTVFYYMLGEFQQDSLITQDIEGKLGNGELGFVFLFVITILLSIVMANLLIGLAVGDIEKMKKNASFEKKLILVNYLQQIDKIPILKRFNLLTHVRYPNADVAVIRQLWRYIWRATKEDAISEEESGDSQVAGNTMCAEDKFDYIMDRLDKLATIVQKDPSSSLM